MAPIAVDNWGVDPAVLAGLATAPKLAVLTPLAPIPARHDLASCPAAGLAEDCPRGRDLGGTWIVKDDYDCEYRYSGPPLQALQGLDRGVYVGTSSKVLFPGFRLGYVVLPPELVEGFVRPLPTVTRRTGSRRY